MTTQTKENPAFAAIRKKYGFLPNILREMGETSPSVLNAYLAASEALAHGTLTQAELNTVMLEASRANGCHYCTKAHAAILRSAGASRADTQAVLEGRRPSSPRLKALVRATRLVMDKKGHLKLTDLDRLEREGVDKAQLYEIIALVGLKTITNYINHINGTEVDGQFASAGK